ncbi:hypothetical protein JCM19296_2744 [Nonlabens ulvanivorans]|uniref:Uncharacterized protein n=1 Tax=Nonlabens ulvanivorans TaxID=906888 RepID=A0A081DDZ3_NONUL|nr:hypothetical protein [Nonlabens ulvanivorans]GAK77139.1 hypothetical protein JCM19296_2744 [Nonlabens ulvanivorans]
MKRLIILIIFISSQLVVAQNEFIEVKEFLSKIENSDSLLIKLNRHKFKNGSFDFSYSEFSRKIDFGYLQHRISVGKDFYPDFKLNFFSKDGVIKFGWISKYDGGEEKLSESENFKENQIDFRNYLNQHNAFYGSNLSLNEFTNQIITEYVVAFGCGYSGNYLSKENYQTQEYIDQKDIKSLKKLLTSFSPELQTLGAIGLIQLKSNDGNKIIRHLKNRNSVLFSCRGCSLSHDETFIQRIGLYE